MTNPYVVHIESTTSFADGEASVAGWYQSSFGGDDLWVSIGDERVPCLAHRPRPDVAEYFQQKNVRYSAFCCRFPIPRHGPARLCTSAGDIMREISLAGAHAFPSSADAQNARPYERWLHTHEPGLFWPAADTPSLLSRLRLQPRISIIVPTYNTPLYYLHRCIHSVRAQRYPFWELCIADDGSSDQRMHSYLKELAGHDPRITVTRRPKGGGISAASNTAIASAEGEFAVLLDHDDELHPCALLEIVRVLNSNPELDFLYSDEDKIDDEGRRSEPALKPAFDNDLLLGFNYIGHIVCARVPLLRQIGGFRSVCDGAQDWDLLLRLVSSTQPTRIHHIPKPLYHWRRHEQSTAMSLDAKPYAVRAWKRVLTDYVIREKRVASVTDGLFRGSMRVRQEAPNESRVAVAVRVRDGASQKRALRRTRFPAATQFFHVFMNVVTSENASLPLLTVDELNADVVILVNCAVESVNHAFIDELVAQAMRSDCGVVGGITIQADQSIVAAGLVSDSSRYLVNAFESMPFSSGGYMGQARCVRTVPAITSHFFATRPDVLRAASGLARIGEDLLDQLCTDLIRYSHEHQLKVLVTPYAVATLRHLERGAALWPDLLRDTPSGLIVNPILEKFTDPWKLLREGF